MAFILENNIEVSENWIKADDVKVVEIKDGKFYFINYLKLSPQNNPVDYGKDLKVKYFKEWLIKSQTKTAQDIVKKYF